MAFNSIAPSYAASTSSKKPCYDVFINDRGNDVKRKLANTIYNMLDLMGVQAFLDQEELEVGDSFPHGIEEAMRSASVHIAIFSPSYAESPWCLEELSFMFKIEVTIIPVFYHVDPSDLRYVNKGIYAYAFSEHERKPRYNPQKIDEWKDALKRVSYLDGCIVDDDKSDQGKLLREIMETALHKINKPPLEVARFPVGLEEAVDDFQSKVGSSNENVHIVGIVGLGGIGKTTLAKALYNKKCSSMKSSFLFNVRNVASTNTLHKLQEKLLKDLRIQHPLFDSKDEGMGILARHLRSMAVLLVLDDVDNVEQMHALLPQKSDLGGGSFIIVTTRDVDVLTSWGISSIYKMKKLGHSKAKQLFCKHAFMQPYSKLEFENLVENGSKFQDLIDRFVKACNGLPLSLKVFGAMVNSQNKAFWEFQLQKISITLPEEITKCLKVSYDALDPLVQQMFLDVACFFIGEKRSLAVAIWDGAWSGQAGWETLVNKCLVGLDENNNIEMHDHLRDLGREIAGDLAPSRIWKEELMKEGRTLIRGIVPKQFTPLESFMKNIIERTPSPHLQLLTVYGNEFTDEFAALSKDLVWLRWYDFNKANLPSWLSFKNLRVLELEGAKNLEELWKDDVEPPSQLTELIIKITKGACFRSLPRSIGHLKHLKKLVLHGNGSGMRSLPENFCHLQSLEILELQDFPLLSLVPHDFRKLIKLSNITIVKCPKLEELPHLTTHVSLIELDMRHTGLRELAANICQLTKLKTIVIHSHNLTSLPESLGALPCLTYLDIWGIRLTSLPESLGALPCLTSLRIAGDSLTSLPESLGALRRLTSLSILGFRLTSLPESLGALPCLTDLDIRGDSLTSLPESLGALPCLTSLRIRGDSLTSLPESLGALRRLTSLRITGFRLTSLPESLGALRRLTSLSISGFRLTSLPESLGALPCLTSLNIWGDSLTSLPESLGALPCLTSLSIRIPIVEIGLGIGSPSGCNLNSLKSLVLDGTRVCRISISDYFFPSLEELTLQDNDYLTEIETLPGNVKKLTVERCQKMKSMRGIDGLLNLQKLKVSDCGDLEVVPCPPYMHSVGYTISIRGCPKARIVRSKATLCNLCQHSSNMCHHGSSRRRDGHPSKSSSKWFFIKCCGCQCPGRLSKRREV